MAFQEYLETSIGIDIHQQQELQNFDKKYKEIVKQLLT